MADVTTLRNNGDFAHRVDIVIVAEGYTQDERSQFLADAQKFNDYLFSSSNKLLADPFFTYASFFNTQALFVASQQSGYSTDSVKINTAFGASAHTPARLLYGDGSAVAKAVKAALPDNAHELVITLINTADYGGAGGGETAWTSARSPSSFEIALHEIGHSFAGLQDEYVDSSISDQYSLWALNFSAHVSQTSDPSAVPWKDWIGYQDSLGTVGVYEGGYYRSSGVWRATANSKMKSLGVAFSAPEKEAFIDQFYKVIGDYATIHADTPLALRVATPDNSLFSYRWSFEGQALNTATDKFSLVNLIRQKADGAIKSTVTLEVTDATGLVRKTDVIAQSRESLTYSITGDKISLDAGEANYVSTNSHAYFLFGNELANMIGVTGTTTDESYIEGGSGNDLLSGSAGDIYFDGGFGVDRVYFLAKRADATITRNADGVYTISSALDGADRIINAEYVQFADETVALTLNTAPIRNNFNGDGKSDILLYNVQDSSCCTWSVSDLGITDYGYVGWAAGLDWVAKVTGDFNSDGRSDIVLQNVKDGSCYVWALNGRTLVDYGYVGWTPGPDWRVATTGDFNGDGKGDILLQNAKDGSCYVWEMNGKALVDYGYVSWTPGAEWQVKGAGDFNGDGKSDILLQNAKDGSCYVWNMDGKTLVDYGYVGWTPGAEWQVRGVGDFNADGKSDILLQNAKDGSCYLWEMNGKALVDSGYVGWTPGPDWQVVGASDFNGDEKSDIILQNAKDGACYIWEMNGKALLDFGYIGWTPGADWHATA